MPVAHPTGWATSVEYYIRNSGYKAAIVGTTVDSSPIAEPQLLASTSHLSAMTPGCATEPSASVLTTVGAYPMLQSYATPFSVVQSTHGQHPAAHDNRTAHPANLAAPSANLAAQVGSCLVTALAGQWIAHCGSAQHLPVLCDSAYGHSAGLRTT